MEWIFVFFTLYEFLNSSINLFLIMLNPALTQRDIKLEVVKFLDKGEIQKCHKVCSNWKREFQVPQYMQSPVDPIRRGFQTIEINFDESFVGYNGVSVL